jgi:hypothetical protein
MSGRLEPDWPSVWATVSDGSADDEEEALLLLDPLYQQALKKWSGWTLPLAVRLRSSPTFPTGALILEFCRQKLNLFKGR